MESVKWEILNKNKNVDIVKTLLTNRGIKTKKQQVEFLDPKHPNDFRLKELKIDKTQVEKTIRRINTAIAKKEKIVVYGDYDADGVCATAIVWEVLWNLKADVMPYIPERFSEGYGLNEKSVEKLKEENPNLGLIITVDHGIVAGAKIEVAKALGIDVVITDHHEPGKKKPKPLAQVHTTKISGSAVAWILAREIKPSNEGLELVAIGTIADQLALVG